VLTSNKNVVDIARPDYFHLTSIVSSGNTSTPSGSGLDSFNFTATTPNETNPLPLALDRLIKLYYSSVLADFGMLDKTVYQNMSLLEAWAKEIWPLWESTLDNGQIKNLRSILGTVFDHVGSITVPPAEESIIYNQYQCQVPKLKPTSSLIMSMILADLVFLHALWWLLNIVTAWWLRRSDAYAMNCAGCLARKDDRDSEVLRKEIRQILSECLLSKEGQFLEEFASVSQQRARTSASRRGSM